MKEIKSIEELKQLSPKDKFYVIENGELRSYIFCGQHPIVEKLAIAVSCGDYAKAIVFSSLEFEYGRKTFLAGKYDSKIVGEVMLAQLNANIKSVNHIYLKKDSE